MKKHTAVIAILMFIFGTAATAPAGQEEVRPGTVIVKEVNPFVYVCVHKRGAFTQIQDAVSQLMQELQNQNLSPMGGMIGVYYFDPENENMENIEWDIGFPVPVQALVQMPLQKKQWSHTMVAATMHVGAYEETASTYEKILDWMDKNGYEQDGPVAELYQDMNPAAVNPANLRTEIWIPCRKR